jgi:hypothetical protein
MVPLIYNLAAQYRRRAEETRARAEATTDESMREILLEAAKTWERMADYEEKHPTFAGLFGNGPHSS